MNSAMSNPNDRWSVAWKNMDIFLKLGVKILRTWESKIGIPATFLVKDQMVSEIGVILDSQGHRYLIYVTSPGALADAHRPSFLPWRIAAVKQFGDPWKTQEQLVWKAFPWCLRRRLDLAHEAIERWIADCGAT